MYWFILLCNLVFQVNGVTTTTTTDSKSPLTIYNGNSQCDDLFIEDYIFIAEPFIAREETLLYTFDTSLYTIGKRAPESAFIKSSLGMYCIYKYTLSLHFNFFFYFFLTILFVFLIHI
jgi:hypothetical protein